MTGDIMSVSRLRMATDGKGVSTLVAFYGCPLKCEYCINECNNNKHTLLGTARALYEPEELIELLRKDAIYYLMTGGGIVFGGGEPLLQAEFIHEVCRLAGEGWKKRIETSLNVPWESVATVVGDIDEWIIDIKDLNKFRYQKYTGSDNKKVLNNLMGLRRLLSPEAFRIRVPHIRGYNTDEQVARSAEWVKKTFHVEPDVFDYIVV
ncbi:MAG: radical SAM protein [Lachnospiraceae bacterium]|nr:radical SAM protein [Lachnospiraceae bacterium]